eukprot:m.459393 g.459393  ORF g.459393 m.459393 type:complete len:58 (+) comp20341_c2_seq1:1731-1904(+)
MPTLISDFHGPAATFARPFCGLQLQRAKQVGNAGVADAAQLKADAVRCKGTPPLGCL